MATTLTAMDRAPEASVVIIVKNGASTIGRQLDALAAQQDAPPFEIIVADNGSDDGTSDIVRDWIKQGIGAASKARLVDASAKAGIPYARNTGVAAARGRVIAWCDADDAVRPGWVAAMAAAVTTGAAGGRIIARRSDGTPEPTAFPDGLQQTAYLPFSGNCNLAFARDTFYAVGGYDESLPAYGCEDLDLCWRIQEAGHPMVYAPDAVIEFTITSRGKAVRKEFQAGRARMAVAIRHPRSTQSAPPTLRGALREAIGRTVNLPYRMIRPGRVARTRRIRWSVGSWGRAVGYWQYAIRRKPSQYVAERTRSAP